MFSTNLMTNVAAEVFKVEQEPALKSTPKASNVRLARTAPTDLVSVGRRWLVSLLRSFIVVG